MFDVDSYSFARSLGCAINEQQTSKSADMGNSYVFLHSVDPPTRVNSVAIPEEGSKRATARRSFAFLNLWPILGCHSIRRSF